MTPAADSPAFLADEHIPLAVVAGLRRLGVDIVSLGEVGRLSLMDEGHLVWAAEHRRLILTHDRDFLVLAAKHPHAGVAYCRMYKHEISGLITAVSEIWESETLSSCVNRVFYL